MLYNNNNNNNINKENLKRNERKAPQDIPSIAIMDRETSPKPPMCRGGCGFYGSAATEGLCSKCYKKHLKRKQEFLEVSRNSAPKSASPPLSVCKSTSSCYSTSSDNSITEFNVCNATGQSNSKRANSPIPNALDNNSEQEENLPSTSTVVPLPATEESQNENENENEDNIPPPETESKEKKSHNRCAECGKKVGLTGFTCRCGGLYCPLHRYSDRHNCTFDYRELGAEEIRRNNPTVTAEKIRKI